MPDFYVYVPRLQWQASNLRFTLRRLFLAMSSFSKRMVQGMACLTDRVLDS